MADPVIDEIKQRIDIVDLVSQSVPLQKSGRTFKGRCPFHQEKTPSFHVYPEQGTYHCFGCGKHGDVFTWLQETEHLEFGEALRRLADRAGVRLPDRATAPPNPAAAAARDALSAAAAWFHEQLLKAPEAEPARRYLAGRGLALETVQRFQLGWAPDRWDALTQHLRRAGFTPEQLEETGLARRSERSDGALHDLFRARVIFPIRDADGKTTGFGGRVLGNGQPKYLNSPQTPYFDKSATLYGLDLAKPSIRSEGSAVVVEGYMDVVLPHQHGFGNVVAALGTALTERQIELLRRYTSTIIFALDADAAGQAATLRGLEVARQALAVRRRPVPGVAARRGFLSLAAGQIKIAVLQGGKDPDEMVREDPDAWRQALAAAVPMTAHKIDVALQRVDLNDPQSKLAAVQEIARFLVLVPDRIEWEHYVDRVAQRLRLDVRAVRAEVAQAERSVLAEERRRVREAATSATIDAPRRDQAASPDRVDNHAPVGSTITGNEPHEEYLISLLVQDPRLMRALPGRLTPEDFRLPECRELFRRLARAAAKADSDASERPDSAELLADPIRLHLDVTLQEYYDALCAQARRRPPQTDSQVRAAVAEAARRLRERNLRQRLQEAQYLLAEAEAGSDERTMLEREVARVASQLWREQLEQSRNSPYTSVLG